MNFLRNSLTLLVVAVLVNTTFGQETLQEKYETVVQGSETYQQFKVIPRTEISGLWAQVKDSLDQKNRQIVELQKQLKDQKAAISEESAKVSSLQIQLDESLNQNDSISFLGISFSKTGYHIMVWTIILILAVLAVLAYFMFMNSNRVTKRKKRDYDSLNDEYEAHKTKAREAQVKLKRELQTAVNQLNERRN